MYIAVGELVHPKNPVMLMQKLLLEDEMHVYFFFNLIQITIQNSSSTASLQRLILQISLTSVLWPIVLFANNFSHRYAAYTQVG